jgi:hypothetical protein
LAPLSPINTKTSFSRRSAVRGFVALICALAVVSAPASAAGRKNPTSKFYVADVNGDVQIETSDKIDNLTKKSSYDADGVVVETKANSNNAMVFSNGTGAYFDQDTRVEIREFSQERFTPNRTDMDAEPSISQTRAFVARGSVGLCTSELVAGSNMTYETPHGSINIRAKRVVIAVNDQETKISMIEGESAVKGGDLDLGGQILRAGQQAIIRKGAEGQPSSIEIIPIPNEERPALEEKVGLAFQAKRTVYFEVRQRAVTGGSATALASSTEAAGPAAESAATESPSPVSAFDSPDGGVTRTMPISQLPTAAGTQTAPPPPTVPAATTVTEIVAVPVVPQNPPGIPVSASRLPTLAAAPR